MIATSVHTLGRPAAPRIAPMASARTPLFEGRALDEGTHLNVVGSNFLNRAEVDATTVHRADTIVCDSIEQCRLEAGDFVQALEAGAVEW